MKFVRELPPAVWQSPEVQYAVQVTAAAAENNFARFFRLARQGSAVQASVLHRHFDVVRVRALKAMHGKDKRPCFERMERGCSPA